jgi:hypothetical protein
LVEEAKRLAKALDQSLRLTAEAGTVARIMEDAQP